MPCAATWRLFVRVSIHTDMEGGDEGGQGEGGIHVQPLPAFCSHQCSAVLTQWYELLLSRDYHVIDESLGTPDTLQRFH